MPTIRIPRSSPSRRERTYAQLILRVPRRPRLCVFEGEYFRAGECIDEDALWPTPEYPAIPLLVEFAGNDRSGRGHNRSRDIHILWQYDAARRDWREIARVLSQGPEWFYHLAPIAQREIAFDAPPINFVELADAVTTRVLAILDGELLQLEDEGRARVLSFLHDAFTARLMSPPDEPLGYY